MTHDEAIKIIRSMMEYVGDVYFLDERYWKALAVLEQLEAESKPKEDGRLGLRDAFGAGWVIGYKAKHVEPDWIVEEFDKWLKYFEPDSIVEPSEEVRKFAKKVISTYGSGVMNGTSLESFPIYQEGIGNAANLITARDERIRRECCELAERAIRQWNILGQHGGEYHLNELVRGTIMGKEASW